MHAERQCGSQRAGAGRRIRVGNFLDVNGAARAGHGDELLAGAANELALYVARGPR
jgi:hypothetical protein